MPSPNDAFIGGLQVGNAVQVMEAKRQQQEQAQQAQMQRQQVLSSLLNNPNPTATDYANASVMVPELREHFDQAWKMRSADQQAGELSRDSQVYSALISNRPDVAAQQARTFAESLRNSGDEERARLTETFAQMIEADPALARMKLGLKIAAAGDKGKTILGGATAMQEAPAKRRQAEAEAATAEVGAKYADQKALLDLQEKGWNIRALEADVDYKKQSARIQAMNAAIAREGNDLKRMELKLKIDEAITTRDTKVREKVAAAESGASAIDNMLNTIERIKRNPRLDDVVGGVEGRMPAVRDDSVDAVALIETLGSQAFLAQIPNIKGMGALSNAEGEKLQSALQNLSRTQSEAQFRANLDEAARLLLKGRASLERSTGVPLPKPDTPAKPGSRPPLASFNKPGG